MKRSLEVLTVLSLLNIVAFAQTSTSTAPKIASINDLEMAYARSWKAVCKGLGMAVPKFEIDKRKEPAKRDAIIHRLYQIAQMSLQKTNAPKEQPSLAGKVLVANLSPATLAEVRWLVKTGYLPTTHPLVNSSRNLTQRELGRAFGHVMSKIGDLASKKEKS